jgi:hypothetical protein
LRLTKIEFYALTIKGELELIPEPLVDPMQRMMSFPNRRAFSIAELFIKWKRVKKNGSNFKNRIATYNRERYIFTDDYRAVSSLRLASTLYDMALDIKVVKKARTTSVYTSLR